MNHAIQGVMRDTVSYAEFEINDGLVVDVVQDSRSCLADMSRLLHLVVSSSRAGDEAIAAGHFLELIAGLDMLTRAVEVLGAAFGSDFKALEYKGGTVEFHLNGLNSVLMEILGSQERNDWILLGDLLEYELRDHLVMWEEIFAMLETELCRDDNRKN